MYFKILENNKVCIRLKIKLIISMPLHGIDKLYTQIGKVFSLHLRIEPFAALFLVSGIALAHIRTETVGPACRPSTVVLAWYCTAGVS